MKEKIIIDCDPGTDDALVIGMALANPKLEVLGITTVAGNRDLEKTTLNALRTLEYFGRTDVPVYRGAQKPLKRELFRPSETSPHGIDGLGDCGLSSPKTSAREDAVGFIKEQLEKYPREITLFGIGPLTNIAKVLKVADPPLIKQLYLMSGAFEVPGNATEFAEFNTFIDPEAASLVYRANIPTKVVGLDVTNPVTITRKEFERLRNYDTREVKFFVKINEKPLSRKKKDAFAIFWDPVAFAWFTDPQLIQSKRGAVTVELEGKEAGMTKFQEGEDSTEVGFTIQVPRFFDILYQFFGLT